MRSRPGSFREPSLGCQWQKLRGETRDKRKGANCGNSRQKRLINRGFMCYCHGRKSLCTEAHLGEGGKSSYGGDCERGRVCVCAMQPAALFAA